MNNITEEIWIKFENKLRAFVLSKVHNESIAGDILQDVFIKIHANIDKLNDDTKIQSWIYQITRNLIIDYFRHRKRNEVSLHYHNENEEDISNEFMIETLEDMVKMMDNLSPEYCEALCLTELGGISQKVYAEKAGISYTAAKSRVQRARKKLKDLLMNCCHYQFDKYGTVIDILPVNCCTCNDE